MDLTPELLAITVLLSIIIALALWRRSNTAGNDSKGGDPPPEPAGALPLIGHLHLLGGRRPPCRSLADLADKHGPIFGFRLGVHRAVVVSSWEAVKECFTHNDRILASRPVSSHGKYLGYDNAGFGFVPYGPYWRQMRKLVLVELLSGKRLEKLKRIRISEIEAGINELYSISRRSERQVIAISRWLGQLTLNIIIRMIAGKRYFDGMSESEDEETKTFRRVVKEFMKISGEYAVSDIVPLPFVGWIDLLGKIKEMKRISKELDTICEGWLREHIRRRRAKSGAEDEEDAGEEQDFMDVMLSAITDDFTGKYTRDTIIKATIMTIIIAGADTTSVHLEWLISLLLNNKQVLKRAQEEMDLKVGKQRWVQESDIPDLLYLQAVVKEALRVYPPGPLAVPHLATDDCRVGGFDITRGTRVLVNVWKLHRDPRVWFEPDEFRPERFLTDHAEVEVLGQQFEFIPFGSGRRSCPGVQFAQQVTHLTLARLIQGFEITTPSGETVDMTEGLGVTLPRATPLEVVVVPRLPDELYIDK